MRHLLLPFLTPPNFLPRTWSPLWGRGLPYLIMTPPSQKPLPFLSSRSIREMEELFAFSFPTQLLGWPWWISTTYSGVTSLPRGDLSLPPPGVMTTLYPPSLLDLHSASRSAKCWFSFQSIVSFLHTKVCLKEISQLPSSTILVSLLFYSLLLPLSKTTGRRLARDRPFIPSLRSLPLILSLGMSKAGPLFSPSHPFLNLEGIFISLRNFFRSSKMGEGILPCLPGSLNTFSVSDASLILA